MDNVSSGKDKVSKSIRALLNFLLDKEFISEEDAVYLKKPLKLMKSNPDVWVPSTDSVQHVINNCLDPDCLLFFKLLLYSGIRVTEAHRIFENFNKKKMHIVESIAYYDIDWTRGKKKSNKAFMPKELAQNMRHMEVDPEQLRKSFYRKQFALKYCRKFFVNFCSKEGVPDSVIEYMIGHSGGSTLAINYLHKHQRAIDWYSKISPKLQNIIG